MTRKVTNLPVTEKTVCTTNADQARKTIDMIVIHTMVGSADSADHRFNDCGQKVSAHYGVLLTGEIWHWVDEDWVAYHAGNYAMNQRSIGIEHEDNGDYNGVRPDSLYTASAKLVADICKFYGIPCDRQHILKHSEVVATGCPDALDIDRIVDEAYILLHPILTPPSEATMDFTGLITELTKTGNEKYGVLNKQQIEAKFTAKDLMIHNQLQTIGDLGKQVEELKDQIYRLQSDNNSLRSQLSDCQNENELLKRTKYIHETFGEYLKRILRLK